MYEAKECVTDPIKQIYSCLLSRLSHVCPSVWYARLCTQISDNTTARDTMFIMIISNIVPFYPKESGYN